MGGCGPCKGQKAVMPIECTVFTGKQSSSLLAACTVTSSALFLSSTSPHLIHVPVLSIRHSHLYRRRKKHAGKAQHSSESALSHISIAV